MMSMNQKSSPPICNRRVLGLLCVASMLLPGGCDDSSAPVYAGLDELPAVPEGRPAGRIASSLKAGDTTEHELAKECGTRTGRDLQGQCVFLPTKSSSYGQRVQIPSGEFVRGHVPTRYSGSKGRKQPAVRWAGQPPRLDRVGSFWIDLTEVSRAAYETCVDSGACTKALCTDGNDGGPPSKHESGDRTIFPQTCVSHAQAEIFCQANDGRLPTEAEWEFAARGVDARVYPWGNMIRDEIMPGLVPIGVHRDEGYFGLRGQGSNAWEWVADVYEIDSGFSSFLAGKFRERSGPLRRSRAAWEKKWACGEPASAGCRAPSTAPLRHVVKHAVLGKTNAAREPHEGRKGPDRTMEGWRAFEHHPMLGFRCAQNRAPGDLEFTVPAVASTIPTTGVDGHLEFFGGVAESVSSSEASRFCKNLTVEDNRDWRLPSFAEIKGATKFRGPGPFWTTDGAVEQTQSGAEAPWEAIEVKPNEALLARCVRSL